MKRTKSRALFLLVSHAPGRLLPTIRSRCRRLNLKPLAQDDVVSAATAALGADADPARIAQAVEAAGGSVARALMVAGGQRLELYQRVAAMLAALPQTEPRALHALGDRLDGEDRDALGVFLYAVRDWLSRRLDHEVGISQRTGTNGGTPEAMSRSVSRRAALVAGTWDRLNRRARDVEMYNLDRKPLVFAVFGQLAEAAGG